MNNEQKKNLENIASYLKGIGFTQSSFDSDLFYIKGLNSIVINLFPGPFISFDYIPLTENPGKKIGETIENPTINKIEKLIKKAKKHILSDMKNINLAVNKLP